MAKMNSNFKYMFDAAPSITLIAKDGVAKTENFNGTPIVLDEVDGYWNSGELADQTFAVVVNVTALTKSARRATMTFASVVATDTFTLSDGVNSKVFTAVDADPVIEDGEFLVGADNTATAANAAAAIQAAFVAGDIAISATSALAVITLTNTLGTGGTITEAETTITTTAFAGNNESYTLELEAGPVGFATSIKPGVLTISEIGQYVILVDLDTIRAMKSDAASIRLVGTLAGVAPSITAHSWIAGIQH